MERRTIGDKRKGSRNQGRECESVDIMTKEMTYSLLKILVIGFLSFIGAAIVIGGIMCMRGSIEYSTLLEAIKIGFNIFVPIVMALVGYFIGKRVE